MAKLVSGLPDKAVPKPPPNVEPNPFAPAGLTLAKGDVAAPEPPKLRVGVTVGVAAGLGGDRAPNGEAEDADPPKTLPFVVSPRTPNGDAFDAANLAKPELANAEADVPLLLSLADPSVLADRALAVVVFVSDGDYMGWGHGQLVYARSV